ncbi:MAG TPA: serine hydrolase domain-containing protein [Candidatus Eremiobacteraceae bacterium]|nr:serine hydrolase domain-containing protein [Candidatus Eremiobacteraceae bacterium]
MLRALAIVSVCCLCCIAAGAPRQANPGAVPPLAAPSSFPTLPGFGVSPTPAPLGSPTSSPLTSDQMQKIDQLAQAQLVQQAIPGLSLAIVRGGNVVYARGYGYASLELQQVASESTLYEAGSIAKQFTAGAVLLLAEDGKLSIDAPLAAFVPDFPNAKTITLRELLTMTSGIPDYTDLPMFDQAPQSDVTPATIVALVKDQPLDFKPGTSWEYSNTNYVLLGMVIEKVSGESYANFINTRIIRPLSMNATQDGNAGASSPNLATGYTFDGQTLKLDQPWDLDWAYATGDLVSNVLDLAVWDTSLLAGKAVTIGSLREMWTPLTLPDGTQVPYGFGWSVGRLDGHRVIDDNGGLPGYNGRNALFPNDDFDVIVLANSKAFDAGPIVRGVFEQFFPPTPAELAEQSQGDDAALAHARDVFHRLQTGTLDVSQLTPQAAKRFSAKILDQAKSSLGRLGQPLRFDQTDKYPFGTTTEYYYRVTFKDGVLGFSLSFDASGAVGEVTAWPL